MVTYPRRPSIQLNSDVIGDVISEVINSMELRSHCFFAFWQT